MDDYEKEFYESEYKEEFESLLEGVDPADRGHVVEQHFADYNVRHTGDPRRDARRNVMNSVRDVEGRKDPVNDFCDYLAQKEGVSKREVRQWKERVLQEEEPYGLGLSRKQR